MWSSVVDPRVHCFYCYFQPIILVLLDIPPMLPVLDGVVMELQDCALPLLMGEPTPPHCPVLTKRPTGNSFLF